MSETRKPLRFANYHGDARDAIGRVMGPNMLREPMVVVSADFDVSHHTTRLGFAFATVPDIERTREEFASRHAQAEQHPVFFKAVDQ